MREGAGRPAPSSFLTWSSTPTLPLPRRARAAALSLLAAAAFAGTLVRPDDPDMFHHLALGREIVRTGLFTDERLVFPSMGGPTGVPPYWLGSVVIYLWHALLGAAGLSLFAAVVGALLCLLLVADSAPRGARHSALTLAAAALPSALALEVFRYRAVPRPEVLAVVLLAWTMWAIRRFEDGRRPALLLFPAVAILWTNLHPSTAVGLAPIAILALTSAAEAVLARVRPAERPPPWRGVLGAAAVLVAGVLATAVRPGFTSTLGFAVRFALATAGFRDLAAAEDPALRNVALTVLEMQGGGAALWTGPVGALVFLSAIAFVANWRALRAREVLTVAAFAALPFAAVRFAVFFAVVAAPIAARNLGAALSRLPAVRRRVPVQALASAAAVAFAIASLPYGALAPHVRLGLGPAWEAFPVRAADYLEAAAFEGRLFNTFHMGGYLEWRRVGPPYQDGRGTAPPEDAPGSTTGPLDRAAFAPLDARYRFDALVLAYPSVPPELARALGPTAFGPDPARWSLVAFDDGGLLYLRRDGRYAGLAARDEYRAASPADPFLLASATPRTLPPMLAELRRAAGEAPRCVLCRYLEAELALASGRAEEAAGAAAAALPLAYGPARAALESVAARAAAARTWRRDAAR